MYMYDLSFKVKYLKIQHIKNYSVNLCKSDYKKYCNYSAQLKCIHAIQYHYK